MCCRSRRRWGNFFVLCFIRERLWEVSGRFLQRWFTNSLGQLMVLLERPQLRHAWTTKWSLIRFSESVHFSADSFESVRLIQAGLDHLNCFHPELELNPTANRNLIPLHAERLHLNSFSGASLHSRWMYGGVMNISGV